MQSIAATISVPAQNFFSMAAFSLRDAASFISSIGELKQENERLERDFSALASELAALRDVVKENERLRSELGLLPRERYVLQAAEVRGRGSAAGEGTLIINRGSRAGLQKDMPVIVGKGVLVGRVTEVFPFNASVKLLAHPGSYVNGVTSGSEAKGIVKGEHGLGLLYDMVQQSDTLSSGDTVITSGLDPSIPRGFLIGTLQETGFSEDRLYRQAALISPVKMEDVRYVFVVKGIQEP